MQILLSYVCGEVCLALHCSLLGLLCYNHTVCIWQLLENTGKYVTVVEPDSISRIIGKYRKFGATAEIRRLLRDIVRLECRPYRSFQPSHGYVIKVIALCASAMPLLGYQLFTASLTLYFQLDVGKLKIKKKLRIKTFHSFRFN